ncbi:MAG: OmpA family protein [Saprospiraceae bacterium]
MCYLRCPTGMRDEEIKHEIVRAYKDYKVVPAEYKTVQEEIIVRPASIRYEYVPAVYRKVKDTILVEQPVNKITLVPVQFVNAVEEIVVRPAFARFERKPSLENCKSKDPRDCDVYCYVEYKEEKKEIPVKKIVASPSVTRQTQVGKFKVITRDELVSAATVREIAIPAESVTVSKRILVKDETVDTVYVGAVYRQEPRLVADETIGGKEGQFEWVAINCKLTEPNVLPIYYALNSAILNAAARDSIDDKLYKLMVEKPLIRVEINSHTDSRASDEFNVDLSQRRAQAVVEYLVSKGIKKDRLIAKGFGETKLVNSCSNGVNCTEEQHAMNRRTEFRVLPY